MVFDIVVVCDLCVCDLAFASLVDETTSSGERRQGPAVRRQLSIDYPMCLPSFFDGPQSHMSKAFGLRHAAVYQASTLVMR